jgi:calcineurin-like phosphoesterase family protein
MQNREIKYWLISDTHFGHEAMKEYCDRPEGFEKLIFKGLERIKPDDILIHLGDICIGNDEEWHDKLKEQTCFKKILVKGNHDKKSNSWYLNHGWDFVCDQFKDELYGKKICFSHKPVVWDGEYDANIHGHFHNSDHRRKEPELFAIKNGYQKLIAVEYTDYKPVTLRSVIEEYEKVFRKAHLDS